jgi:hypothetical protein
MTILWQNVLRALCGLDYEAANKVFELVGVSRNAFCLFKQNPCFIEARNMHNMLFTSKIFCETMKPRTELLFCKFGDLERLFAISFVVAPFSLGTRRAAIDALLATATYELSLIFAFVHVTRVNEVLWSDREALASTTRKINNHPI